MQTLLRRRRRESATVVVAVLILLQFILWRTTLPLLPPSSLSSNVVDDVRVPESSFSSEHKNPTRPTTTAAIVVPSTASMTSPPTTTSATTTTTNTTLIPTQQTRSIHSNNTSSKSNNNMTATTTTIIGFVRIPKTASSSLLKFLNDYSGMQPAIVDTSYNTYDSATQQQQAAVMTEQQWKKYLTLKCFYRYDSPSLGLEHDRHRTSTIVIRNDTDDTKGRSNSTTERLECGHTSYGNLIQTWTGEQQRQRHEQKTNATDVVDGVVVRPHMIVMVREPFDRLQSLFYYMRQFVNTTRWCITCGTTTQYKMVRSGDFRTWLNLLHTENKTPPFQYQFLDGNVDRAIQMLQQQQQHDTTNHTSMHQHEQHATVRLTTVTVYLHQCFETSLRLMEKQFSFPNVHAVDKFVSSTDFRTNTNTRTNPPRDTATTDTNTTRRLRSLAKQWFVDEYNFYHEAISQFQRHLSSSGLDRKYHCTL